MQVDAENGEAAIDMVNACTFPLPPIGEWHGQKDWLLRAVDEHGEEVAESTS